jgi:chromosome segregation ATPase
MQELQERHALIQQDMEATLKATEAKVKAIDQLYKEATAENELLYEKFNSELGKIVKALKGKGREDKEELVARLKDSSEEAARAKKENARLKREMVSLRILLKGATTSGNGEGN